MLCFVGIFAMLLNAIVLSVIVLSVLVLSVVTPHL
jgi:hypothetical protein